MSVAISELGAIHIGAAIALFFVAITTVALRFYCRRTQETRLFADDWLSLVAAILALALVVEACLWSTKAGFGYPLMSLKRIQVITFFHILFAQRITYWVISAITKISILLLYRRLFPVQTFFRHLTIFVGFLALSTSVIGVVSFTYRYITFQNQHLTLSAVLADTALLHFVLSGAALSFTLDCIILCMPLPLIWSMNLDRHKKWSVSGVFLLGGLTCVSSALRIVFIYGVHHHTYQYALEGPSCIWSTVEALLSIVSACLPTLRPLFMRRKKALLCEDSEADEEAADALGAAIELAQRHRYLSVTSTMLTTTMLTTTMNPASPVCMQSFVPREFDMSSAVDQQGVGVGGVIIQHDKKAPMVTTTPLKDESSSDTSSILPTSPSSTE